MGVTSMIARLMPIAFALAFVSGAGAGAESFSDAAGDAGGAPDIVSVAVRNTASDDVVLTVKLANRPTWAGGVLDVFLDTDRNAATGSDGSDYRLHLNEQSDWRFDRWDGAGSWVDAPSDGVGAAYGSGEAEFTFNARHIGSKAFDFWVSTKEGADVDEAPAAPATWTFALTPPRVTGGTPTFSPAAPRAGARFAVSRVTLVLDGVTRTPARSFGCDATLAGKYLYATRRCTWSLPRSARGKFLSVRVTARTGPGSHLLLFKRFRVR